MAPTAPNLTRLHLEIIARLTAIQPKLIDAHVALRDAQPGYPTSTGGGGSSVTLDAAGNPPGLDRYLATNDQAAIDLRNLRTLTDSVLGSVTQLYDIVTRWTAEPDSTDDKPTRTRGGGDCVCCGRYCSGADTDRLRSGLCDPCRKSWSRSSLERGEWMLARRRELAHDDAA